MKSARWVFAAAALGAALAAPAAPPQRVTLEYEVSRNGTAMVEAVETLEHDGRSYRIGSEWRGKGLFALAARGAAKRSSEGVIDDSGLHPVEFRDQRGEAPVAVAKFDWSRRVLVRQREGRSESTPMPERAHDRLSFAFGFGFAPPAGKEISAVLGDAGGLSRVRYVAAGHELLHTAAGDFDTLHLVKQRDGGDDRGTEIWLATKAHYLPLRILVTEKDGTRIDQRVTRIVQ